ncbi:class E sortase, partial [Candidatus Saccharibacteria bacterium]|nr:class E sortase [Candidatus Saccharibacteria bacterium]
YPERGNPEKGGNFIIAAHRFSIQPTPQSTIEKSPFYNIDKLAVSDKIVIDYDGARYGYEVEKVFDVKPNQIEIEAPSKESKLTLYSCELGGADAGRIVYVAKPLGLIALDSTQPKE